MLIKHFTILSWHQPAHTTFVSPRSWVCHQLSTSTSSLVHSSSYFHCGMPLFTRTPSHHTRTFQSRNTKYIRFIRMPCVVHVLYSNTVCYLFCPSPFYYPLQNISMNNNEKEEYHDDKAIRGNKKWNQRSNIEFEEKQRTFYCGEETSGVTHWHTANHKNVLKTAVCAFDKCMSLFYMPRVYKRKMSVQIKYIRYECM